MSKWQRITFVSLIALALYATSDKDALKNCEKLHSTETCMHELYNGN